MEENAGRHRFIAHGHHVYYKPASPHLSACRRPRTPRRPTGSMAMIAGVVEASLLDALARDAAMEEHAQRHYYVKYGH